MAFEWKYFLDVANYLHQLEKDSLDKEDISSQAQGLLGEAKKVIEWLK
jgi:hypothetical protein